MRSCPLSRDRPRACRTLWHKCGEPPNSQYPRACRTLWHNCGIWLPANIRPQDPGRDRHWLLRSEGCGISISYANGDIGHADPRCNEAFYPASRQRHQLPTANNAPRGRRFRGTTRPPAAARFLAGPGLALSLPVTARTLLIESLAPSKQIWLPENESGSQPTISLPVAARTVSPTNLAPSQPIWLPLRALGMGSPACCLRPPAP